MCFVLNLDFEQSALVNKFFIVGTTSRALYPSTLGCHILGVVGRILPGWQRRVFPPFFFFTLVVFFFCCLFSWGLFVVYSFGLIFFSFVCRLETGEAKQQQFSWALVTVLGGPWWQSQ